MPIDLTQLKSARRIEDRAEVLSFLDERHKQSGECPVLNGPKGDQINKVTSGGTAKVAVPSPEETRRMAEAVGLIWTDDFLTEDGTPRVIPYYPSNEMVDRHGDIVLQNYDFTAFNAAGQILFCHDWAGLSIGRSIFHEVRQVQFTEFDYSGPALFSYALFYGPETYAFADQVFRIAAIRGMPSVSIGFFPGIIVHVEDDEERQRLGLGRWGVLLDANEIVEYSPCAVPANAGALDAQLRSAANTLKSGDLPVLREMIRRSVPEGEVRELDQCVRSVWKEVFEQSTEPMTEPEAPAPGIEEQMESLRSEVRAALAETQETIIHTLGAIRDGFSVVLAEEDDPDPVSPEDDPSDGDELTEEEVAELGVDDEDASDPVDVDDLDPTDLDDADDTDVIAAALEGI